MLSRMESLRDLDSLTLRFKIDTVTYILSNKKLSQIGRPMQAESAGGHVAHWAGDKKV